MTDQKIDKPKVDLFAQFESLQSWAAKPGQPNQIIKAPFGWPGGKSKSVFDIVPHLPDTRTYVEPYGGAGSVLLAKAKSPFEVFNDRNSGVTDFYIVLQDPHMLDRLVERLRFILHSEEYWLFCKNTWDSVDDRVERAARWYTMVMFSFGAMGRNWARSLKEKPQVSIKVIQKLPQFARISSRFRTVQIENDHAINVMKRHDHPETCFYLDPPYIGSYSGAYAHEMSVDDHIQMLDAIFELDGFVALSGYPNQFYDQRDWSDVITFNKRVSLTPVSHHKMESRNLTSKRIKARECLWIKEAS